MAKSWLQRGVLCCLWVVVFGCDSSVYNVTTTVDGASGSLRAAISAANGSDGAERRIEIPSGTYELTLCGADDTNAAGDLDIRRAPISIVGTGPDVVIRQTCAGERVFDAAGVPEIRFSNVRITGGSTSEDGGGVRGASVHLSQVSIVGNAALNGGGVAAAVVNADAATVSDNRATRRGGGIHATTSAKVTRSTIRKNTGASGGGIAVNGNLEISDSLVTENVSYSEFRSPLQPSLVLAAPSSGGGISAAKVKGDRVTISDNRLAACTIFSSILIPPGVSRGGGIDATEVSLTNATVTGNTGPGCTGYSVNPEGAGIATQKLVLEHVTIADNGYGSAVFASELSSQRSLIMQSPGGTACAALRRDDKYNVFNEGPCALNAPGDFQRGALLLQPLSDNGGTVPTRLPARASALVDQIPPADCPLRTDARGKPRPQGARCDIGAVELDAQPDLGAADLSLAFTSAPPTLTAGRQGTWTLRVTNNGPNASAPAVFVDSDPILRVLSFEASNGSCTTTVPRVCTFARIPRGGSETITLVGDLYAAVARVDLHAELVAAQARAPLTDDVADTASQVVADAALRMAVRTLGEQVFVDVFNAGPGAAFHTFENPIDVVFRPAARVEATLEQSLPFDLYQPSESAIGTFKFRLSFEGTPPLNLGTVELRPGPNRLSGPAVLPVSYTGGPDLSLVVRRAPGAVAVGDPVPLQVEVTNSGDGPASDVRVDLSAIAQGGQPSDAVFAWSPPRGSVEATGDYRWQWRVSALAAGERLILAGTATNPSTTRNWLDGIARSNADFDIQSEESQVEVSAAPQGTADIQVTGIEWLPGSVPGVSVVRATIMNVGPATMLFQTFDRLSVIVRTEPFSSSASATPLAGDWDCSYGNQCRLNEDLPPGVPMQIEFTVSSSEELTSVGVSAYSSNFPADPDRSNDGRTLTR